MHHIPRAMNGVTDNTALGRFELIEEGKLAFADYRIQDGVMILPHVEADPALRGRGTAGRLMEGLLEIARSRGLRVTPVCGYAAAFMRKHPDCHDLLS